MEYYTMMGLILISLFFVILLLLYLCTRFANRYLINHSRGGNTSETHYDNEYQNYSQRQQYQSIRGVENFRGYDHLHVPNRQFRQIRQTTHRGGVEIFYDYSDTDHSSSRADRQPQRFPQATRASVARQSEQTDYETGKTQMDEAVRKIQDELLQIQTISPKLPKSKEIGDIVIGVDATPKTIGGYFINVHKRSGQFYSFPVEKLPWKLTKMDTKMGNPAEFEMKNLLFALYLWEAELKEQKGVVHVYTDNNEIFRKQTAYGVRVQQLVKHLKDCQGIQIDVRVRGTTDKYIEDHAKYVKAADDFSRGKFESGIAFLEGYFGIRKGQLEGSHEFNSRRRIYTRCNRARQQLQKMKANHTRYKIRSCKDCKFIEKSPSLQSVMVDV